MAACSMLLSVPAMGHPHAPAARLSGAPTRLTFRNPLRIESPRRRALRLAAVAFKGPEVKKIDDWRVQKMTDMVHQYFDGMLSKCKVELVPQLLDENAVHKDMVRDESRSGHSSITSYLQDVHKAYPNFWARCTGNIRPCILHCASLTPCHCVFPYKNDRWPLEIMVSFECRAEQVGVADDCTVFCSFEGQATDRSPMFTGVDRFRFNKDLTKIVEVEIYRSNWQGAKGHEERKQQRMAMQT